MISRRIPDQSNDSVHLLVSLLVRHPELSRVTITPRFSAIAFFFVVRGALAQAEARAFKQTLTEHVRALHALSGVDETTTRIALASSDDLTFVEIERDAKTVGREEIALIVALTAEAFGERLIVNPPADDAGEEEMGAQDDHVGSALDAVRNGRQRKGLVGFRDDRRVLVYFGK